VGVTEHSSGALGATAARHVLTNLRPGCVSQRCVRSRARGAGRRCRGAWSAPRW